MITPDEFFSQARLLAGISASKPEVHFRSSMSRAYYSMFHEAFVHLEKKHRKELVDSIVYYLENIKKDKTYNRSRIQALDKDYLRERDVNLHSTIHHVLRKLKWDIGNDFKTFRDERNFADYDLILNYDKKDTDDKLDEIERLIKSIQKL